jgi:hypothetical protein
MLSSGYQLEAASGYRQSGKVRRMNYEFELEIMNKEVKNGIGHFEPEWNEW